MKLKHETIAGRFAPSPTGHLHLGSLVAAVGSWLMARASGGSWLLRMDDLDSLRIVPGMSDDIMRTLESFGLFWDGEVSWQSRHHEQYVQAFNRLLEKEMLYPCGCSRKEIALSASAPHQGDDAIPYPGTCRNGMAEGGTIRTWRVRVPEEEVFFNDLRRGRICQNLPEQCGDVALMRGSGEFTYQLAVVVDDYLTGVNQVVRGEDLLSSTCRQIYLQQLLGFPQPMYCHLPLVTGSGGAKLSKRDNLVSHSLKNICHHEGDILLAILRFLGQKPPASLAGASCRDILLYGVENFDVTLLPTAGGTVAI